MNKQDTGSGGGAAVAVVMILVVLAGFCVIVTLGGSLFYLGSSVQPVVVTPPMPVPVVTKAVTAFRTAEISVAADSSLKLDGKPVELNEIQGQLQQIRAASPNLLVDVQIVPEATAPYRAVSDVTDLLTATGFTYTVRSADAAGTPAGATGMGAAGETVVEEASTEKTTEAAQETTEATNEVKEVAESEKTVDETP